MIKTTPEPLKKHTLSKKEKQLRKTFIGASECAAILGLCPYGNTPADIYHRKVDGIDIEQTLPMKLGQVFEPVILEFAAQQLNKSIHKGTRRVHANGVMQCTPDGFLPGEDVLVEVKKVNYYTYANDPSLWGESFTDHIPKSYLIQMQHSLHVLGWQKGYLGVLISDDDFRIYEIDYNEAIGSAIEKHCLAFVNDHLLPKVPPDSPASMETYKAMDRGDKVAVVDDHWFVEYNEAKAAAKEAEKRAEAAKAGVLHQAGFDADVMTTDKGNKFTYREVISNKIIADLVRDHCADKLDAVTKASKYRRFCAIKKK